MPGWLKALGAFAYDFVIGDDWVVAAAVAAGLALTYWISHAGPANPWWLIPALLAFLLPFTLWRAGRG